MARKKPAKNGSRVVRISEENYDRFTELKTQFAHRVGKKKVTYDAFLEEIFGVCELLVKGKEVYCHDKRIYGDIAEARGVALMTAIRNQTIPTMPTILLVVGEDTYLKDARA